MLPGDTNPTARIAIVGVGQVGAAAACALILGSVAGELLLVDVKTDWRDAQVRDLSDVAYSINSGTRVRAATHHEAGQCDMVVITAGSKWSIGETNVQHTQRNVSIMRSVVRAMTPFRPDTVVLVVSNPVDLLTSIAQELSGLSKSRVFGSGTSLDSMRIRGLLADKAKVAADSIHLPVLGIHGDFQVVAWSTATINGEPIDKFFPRDAFKRADLENESKHRSESIICAKGATPFGLGSIVSSICSSVLCDKRDARPVSHFQSEFNCCFSLPAILGREGVMRTIEMTLDSDEQASITRSAKRLRDTVERIQANQ